MQITNRQGRTKKKKTTKLAAKAKNKRVKPDLCKSNRKYDIISNAVLREAGQGRNPAALAKWRALSVLLMNQVQGTQMNPKTADAVSR